MSKFNFCGPSYSSQSLNADAQATINFYPEQIESGDGNTNLALYPTPGIKTFCDLTPGPPPSNCPAVLQSVKASASAATSVSATFPNPVADGSIIYLSYSRVQPSPYNVSNGFTVTDNQSNSYSPAVWGVNSLTINGDFKGARMNGPNTVAGSLTVTAHSTDLGGGNPLSDWEIMAVEVSNVANTYGTLQSDFAAGGGSSTGQGNATVGPFNLFSCSVVIIWAYCAQDTLTTTDTGNTPLQSVSTMHMQYRAYPGAQGGISTTWNAADNAPSEYMAVGIWAGLEM